MGKPGSLGRQYRLFRTYARHHGMGFALGHSVQAAKRELAVRRPRSRSDRPANSFPDAPDILLVLCPAWGVDCPPLGPAYLSRYLREHGFKTAVLDSNIEAYRELSEEHPDLWDCKQVYQWYDFENFQNMQPILRDQLDRCVSTIRASRAPVVGFTVFDSNVHFTIEVIRRLKSKDPALRILVGGPSVFSDHGRRIFVRHLDREIDAFVYGEGEETLLAVMRAIRDGSWTVEAGHSRIPGTVVQSEDGMAQMPPRPQIAELDSIPFPTFEEFDVTAYARPILFLFGTRGCVSPCEYCREIVLWKKYRTRSAEHIHAEIEHHVRRWGIREFGFSDSLINGDMRNLERLCDLLIERGPRIQWSAQAIARRHMGEELLVKMQRSGCHLLSFGIESGSDAVLRKMRKIFTSQEAADVLARTSRAGIITSINLIFGFPGESEDDYRKTLDFLERNQRSIDRVDFMQACDVLSDTALHRKVDRYGIVLPDEKAEFRWFTEDGNTYEVRRSRVLGAAQHIAELSSFSDCDYLYNQPAGV